MANLETSKTTRQTSRSISFYNSVTKNIPRHTSTIENCLNEDLRHSEKLSPRCEKRGMIFCDESDGERNEFSGTEKRRRLGRRGYSSDKRDSCVIHYDLIRGNGGGTENVGGKIDLVSKPRTKRKSSNYLMTLSTEIHLEIIGHFSDQEVIKYSTLCKTLFNIVGSNVWHDRFLGKFDMVDIDNQTSDQVLVLARKYKFRSGILNKPMDMNARRRDKRLGVTDVLQERKCLDMLKSLIIDSNAKRVSKGNGKWSIIAPNQYRMREFFQSGRCNLIEEILALQLNFGEDGSYCGRDHNALGLVIYLCLAQIALLPNSKSQHIRRFDESQRHMYAIHKPSLIFQNKYKQDLNVRWLVHAVNFWRLHLNVEHEGVLAHAFRNLQWNQLPQPWLGKLKTGTQKLGRYWKGAYLFISEPFLSKLRTSLNEVIADELDSDETFQNFGFFFDDLKFPASRWPDQFERVLQGNPFRGKSKSPVVIEHFYGVSRYVDSSEESYFFGCLHAMPSQHKIPGFHRLTMLKFVPDIVNDGYRDAWAYEGCVMPGGRLIFGQWWYVLEGRSLTTSGPFILWNLDQCDEGLNGDDALKFFSSINNLASWE